ncbi:Amino acid ABC transporter membrane protein 1, PAAT family [Lactobacillus helsingborgensis]|uniref:Amino acid ABC transporter permease n=1 Tax=Lactobacillus helsingborgensis TaxID=1218494 RepID=A0A0F4M3B3_9LACO|nr:MULTISPECIES: amino acid ABC transporter permease [Lactobacillus]AWN33098.1 amino acid ABC transporter permease [Lactobacillus helsingborgensis]KJY65370.1 Amino acid ABC transporter membrane protein 1, PAAT family [Lactobacillus helsingborgensis]MBC6356449.1 amino acid ABC transporter permease [Lactobacillus helsingborgensis]MBI0111174.1 amino acid ABC transporter permease [Lactobacillus sp. W8093]RMC53563.1 amino acid ABC transporter permease [Lactobacillus sp. ESL0262]
MINIFSKFSTQLFIGLGWTVLSSVIALFFSLIIGTIFAIMEVVPSKVMRVIGHAYVEIMRNIPLLVITMFFYLVIPMYVVKINGFTAGTIGLTLYTSAFIAETIRSGIQSVSGGQMEGARSTGMTYWQAMRYIILPQAFKIVIPPLGNQFVNLVKNSSVLAFVAGFDLMYQANSIASTTFDTINSYLVVGVLYLIVTLPLSYYMRHLEKKLG